MNYMTIVHETLCAVLFYGVFCRATKSSTDVHVSVRLSFICLGTAALIGIAAPFSLGYHPHLVDILLLSCYTLVQLVTASYWVKGVPDRYLKKAFKINRRATDFQGAFNESTLHTSRTNSK